MIGVGSRLERFMSKVLFICIALSAVTGCRYAPDGGMESAVPISGGSKANSHEKVQLWKDGPYWATTNIGAEKPWDYGYYFWWGDTVGYKCEDSDCWVKTSSFSFDPVSAPTFDKSPLTLQSEGWIVSRDGVNVLVPEHDAAYVHWGGGWRMPTRQEVLDINHKCDWIRTTTNGVIGCVVRGRDDYAANSIFLPCAGHISGTTLFDDGIAGNYWSSVPGSDNIFASELYFSKDFDRSDMFDHFRMFGQSVRAVQVFAE